MVLQDPLEPGGEGEDSDGDAGEDGEEKAGVYCIKSGGEVQTQECMPKRAACTGANAHHELFVDAKDEGHGAAGDAGHDVGAAHGEAARGEAQVLSGCSPGTEIRWHRRIRSVGGICLPGWGLEIGGHCKASTKCASRSFIRIQVSLHCVWLRAGTDGNAAMIVLAFSGR